MYNQTTIEVKVLDVNDNVPVFEEEQYMFFVATDVEDGATIGKVHALDPDPGKIR